MKGFESGDRLLCIDDSNMAEWVQKSFTDVVKKGHQYICKDCAFYPSVGWIVNVRGIKTLKDSRAIGWKASRFARINFNDGKFGYTKPDE